MSAVAIERSLLQAAQVKWLKYMAKAPNVQEKEPSLLNDVNDQILKAKRKSEQIHKEAQKLRRMHPILGPELRRIDRLYACRLGNMNEEVRCPNCHGSDKENTVNGKPWCMKCNVPLVPVSMLGKSYRVIPKLLSLRKELATLNPGLHPERAE